MHVVLADHSFDYLYFKGLTCLTDQLPNPERYVFDENLVAIFGHPDKMILNVENSMTPISVFHRKPPFFGDIILDLLGVINLPA